MQRCVQYALTVKTAGPEAAASAVQTSLTTVEASLGAEERCQARDVWHDAVGRTFGLAQSS